MIDRPHLQATIPSLQHKLETLWARIDSLDVSGEICDLAGRVAPGSRLRTLDAIHLATFRIARKLDPNLEILSFDQRLLREL
jgi:predicted nucleic acid-binding protein